MGIAVSVEGLRKDYHGRERVTAVDGVTFHVPEGEFYTLVGPSGCGKTTTMRCLAGLERPDAGTIVIAGETVSANDPPVFVPAERRSIGMVFQSYAIWPHMTVSQNVAFPLRVGSSRIAPNEVKRRVEEALDLVALGEYRDRMSSALSGGQQQRLALARAIVRRPRLLLLDEPLSNLDARLRDRMRDELRTLQAELGVTTIYVTHDQGEALSMSSYIAVMDAGRIVQEGRPFDVYTQPTSRFVAEFLGNSNVFPASVIDRLADRVVLETRFGTLHAKAGPSATTGSDVVVSVRPENVVLSASGAGNANVVNGCVRSIVFLGEFAESLIECNGTVIRSHQRIGAPFRPGDTVYIQMSEEDCVVIR